MASGKGGVERSGVTVIVPTTAGSIQVLGLRWSQRIPSSRVVLGNETSDQCERWTKDYNSLLRPGDPMRTLLGLPEGGGCRLVVSAEIDHGRSWIVPIAAAHFADARAQAVHADLSRARMLIWGTGALDFSQPETPDQARIVENDYHLTTKIDLSRANFAAAAHDGVPVLCLLPAGPDCERAAGILRKVLGQQPHHIETVASLADIIRPIDAYLSKGDFNAPPEMKYAPVPYTPPPEVDEPVAARVAPGPSSEKTTETKMTDPPPLHGAQSALASDVAPPAAKAAAAKSAGGLSLGVLGGIAAALVAVIGIGGMMLRSGPAPQPQPGVTTSQQQSVRPQVVTVPGQPMAPATTTPAAVISAPTGVAPGVASGAVPPSALPSAAPPAADAGAAVGRLTILTAPAGSSCQAQVLEMNPRFVETSIELGSAQPLLEIDTPALCGLAIAGSGAGQARFAPGTVSGTVASLSSGSRIIFNPSNTTGRLPDIAVSGGTIEKIELRRK